MSKVFFENIPAEMKAAPQWVMWKLENRTNSKGEIKQTKVPYQINGKEAESDNPKTWTSFESACKTYTRYPDKFSGIGFVFTVENEIVGIDFDHVRENGIWDETAIKEIESFESYSEISQSGTGAHVYIKAKMSEDQLDGRTTGRKTGKGQPPREVYIKGRFFVVTGDRIGDEIRVNESQKAFDVLFNKWFSEKKANANTKLELLTEVMSDEKYKGKPRSIKPNISPELTDEEIVDLCMSAKNKEKFIKLYAKGDFSDYQSQSDAVQGLCNIIAFYTQKTDQIDRIFRKSNLMYTNGKWDRIGTETIRKSIANLKETYEGKKQRKEKGTGPIKVDIPFNVVADQILKDNHLFSMRDNGEIYVYKNGVYRAEGTEAILGTEVRELYTEFYKQKWEEVNPDFPLENVPAATIRYVAEVLAYVRAFTHIKREEINEEQLRYLNFKNGLFDLQEWKIVDHTPSIRIIGQFPVTFDAKAECPNILKYLKSCELTKENIDVLTEFAGYSMTPDVRMQKALMIYGGGSNGKSVYINLQKTIIGKDYTSGETLQNLETDKYRIANLYGKRLNAFPDLKDTPLQQNETFNTLTGNELYLTGERKYQNSFDFKPTAKLMFSANKIPFAYSDNYAYYRRWILIKFPHTFEKNEIDENLLSKLITEEEKSGFLNLMLAGLKRLYTNGKFSYTCDVEDVEKEYLLHSDNVTVFEEQCLRDCSGNEEATEKALVYAAYLKWCEANKLTPVKIKVFTKKLEKAGRKVYNTTKYSIETKAGKWFSCYYNTIVDINIDQNQGLLAVA